MKVLMDSNGLQARVHSEDGKRLQTCLDYLQAIPGCTVHFSPVAPLTAELLAEYDVLIITTRKGDEPQYTPNELVCIPPFVHRGGGLFLMSNHADIPGRYPNDFTQNDARLARQFGIEIEKTFFAHPERKSLSEISGAALVDTHPILRGATPTDAVRSFVTINGCSILPGHSDPLLWLPNQMIDHRNGYPSAGRCYAVALEMEKPGMRGFSGRVVVVADSGFIGNENTTFPGVGLIAHGDNGRFVQNAVHWLGHDLPSHRKGCLAT
jgi:hypothetical protein